MTDIESQSEELALKESGKVVVAYTRDMLEDLALGPVTVEFFEQMIDDVCDHYTRKDGEDYLATVSQIGELLDQYLGDNREATVQWLESNNPSMSDAKPIELILVGRGKLVLKFVEKLIQEKDTAQV